MSRHVETHLVYHNLSIYLSVCLAIYLCIYPSIHPSICLIYANREQSFLQRGLPWNFTSDNFRPICSPTIVTVPSVGAWYHTPPPFSRSPRLRRDLKDAVARRVLKRTGASRGSTLTMDPLVPYKSRVAPFAGSVSSVRVPYIFQ